MTARRTIKALIFSLAMLVVSPLVLLAWIENHTWGGEEVFSFCAQLLALVPGSPGSYLRGAYYYANLERSSWETHMGLGSMFTHRGGSLGARASMGSYCVIGHAHIGEAVMIGSRVSIPSGKRQHLDDDGQLGSGTRYDTVAIGSQTWVGEGAIIMANIGRSCIVSAGSVVTRDMPDRSIIGGNPARVIRTMV